MHILLTVSYDGHAFCGWQAQAFGRTAQGVLEKALSQLFQTNISVLGASRTDAKVNALGQRASFFVDHCTIPMSSLPKALIPYLPEDMVVLLAQEVENEFHPIKWAKKKTYAYCIQNAPFPNPMLRHMAAFVRMPLDVSLMQQALPHFLGEHDFAAFKASGGSAKTTCRTIYSASLTQKDDVLTLTISGNGFLYNMVRIISGTLIDIGHKKISPSQIPHIISSKNRHLAGQTAPACGLTLLSVDYTA